MMSVSGDQMPPLFPDLSLGIPMFLDSIEAKPSELYLQTKYVLDGLMSYLLVRFTTVNVTLVFLATVVR